MYRGEQQAHIVFHLFGENIRVRLVRLNQTIRLVQPQDEGYVCVLRFNCKQTTLNIIIIETACRRLHCKGGNHGNRRDLTELYLKYVLYLILARKNYFSFFSNVFWVDKFNEIKSSFVTCTVDLVGQVRSLDHYYNTEYRPVHMIIEYMHFKLYWE